MLKSFPFIPLGITVGVMAADGLVSSYDIDKYAKSTPAPAAGSSPPILKSKALWLQGAALAVGLVGEVAGWHPDITEPFMLSGAGLMAREGALHLAQSRQTTPATTQGYATHVAPPAAAWEQIPRALARPSVNVQGVGDRQPATLAG